MGRISQTSGRNKRNKLRNGNIAPRQTNVEKKLNILKVFGLFLMKGN